jgi:hypothetical protein
MRIHPVVYGIIVLTAFFGIILGFQSVGFWSTSGKVTGDGEAVQPSSSDVNTIKGWMTLEQISATFNVPLSDLLKHFELPADTPSTTAIKDLESETFDTTTLRTWLQSRTQSIETTQTPTSTPEPDQLVTSTPTIAITVIATTEHITFEMTITGKTTFQELLDWGLSKDIIQKVIGGDLPASSTSVKDYATGKGIEFTGIKTLLQAEVDKLKP